VTELFRGHFCGKGDFLLDLEPDILELYKKPSEIKLKNVFFQLKGRGNVKT